MKKHPMLALSLATLLALSGCSGSQADPSPSPGEQAASSTAAGSSTASGDKTPISMWFWGSSPEQQNAMSVVLVNRFNTQNPDYDLQVEYRGSVNKDVAVALAANQGPDIVYESAPSMAITYIKAGKYADLTEYSQQYGWQDKLIGPMYDSCTVDGTLYSIPLGIHVIGIVYNQRTLDEHGWQVPTTLDQLTSIMDEALEKGMYASVTGNKGWKPTNQDYSSLFLTNFAGPMDIYNALQGTQKWNSPNIVYAVEQSAEWYNKGYLCSDYTDMDWAEAAALLADGRAPFYFGPLKFIQNLMPYCEGENKDDFQFAVFPGGRDGVAPSYALGSSAILAVNASTDYKDQAAAFLDIIIDEEVVREMAVAWPGYWGVPLKSLSDFRADDFEGLPRTFMNAIITASSEIENGNFGYDNTTFFSPEVLDHFINIDTVWFGQSTAEELLDMVDASFEKELAAGLVPPVPKPAG